MKRNLFLLVAIVSVVGMMAISGCKKKETYIVTFNSNGGTGTMAAQTFTEGEAQALTRNIFTYEGYTFTGWNTVQGGSGASYTDGQTITATSDMTLYAQWTGNPVTVTFDANGGTGEMAPQTFTIGMAQELSANSFTWENHEFIGWNSAQDGTGTAYAESQKITIEENITLYAQWMAATGLQGGHYYVDLGLPSGTKWATCNVGANSPVAYGDYFAWGETTPKETYTYETYIYAEGTTWDDPKLTKYCNNADYGNNGFTDALTTLEAGDDAATANWGAYWRMPTREEMNELYSNCTHEWTTQNGVNGCLFTGPNGNSIFLPAAGTRDGSGLPIAGSDGFYWSSSLYTGLAFNAGLPVHAWYLFFYSADSDVDYCHFRYYGRSVRPVCVSQN